MPSTEKNMKDNNKKIVYKKKMLKDLQCALRIDFLNCLSPCTFPVHTQNKYYKYQRAHKMKQKKKTKHPNSKNNNTRYKYGHLIKGKSSYLAAFLCATHIALIHTLCRPLPVGSI